MTPESVGVVGPGPRAALFAILLREHGRHPVLGFNLDPKGLVDREALQSWHRQPIVSAPPSGIARYCRVVFLFDCRRDPVVRDALTIQQLAIQAGRQVPLVMTDWRLELFRLLAANDAPLVYHPIRGTRTLDEMASPSRLWLATEHRWAADAVESVWRPIINTVPVARTSLREVSRSGSPLPPSALDEPVDLKATLATISPPERLSNA